VVLRNARLGELRVTVLLACSCQAVDLLAVPIVNAPTPEHEAAARDVVEGFEAGIGPDRVRLTSVEFRDPGFELPEHLSGRYQGLAKRVLLSNSLSAGQVPTVLRHELCHAVDDQGGLVDSSDGLFKGLADDFGVEGPGRADEAMALLCQAGPLGASLLSEVRCPDDLPGSNTAADWLLDTVWIGAPPVDMQQTPPSPAVLFELRRQYLRVETQETVDPSRVQVGWYIATDGVSITGELQADLTTGAVLSDEVELVEATIPEDPLSVPSGVYVFERAYGDAGSLAARVGLIPNGSVVLPGRLVVADADEPDWALVSDVCLSSPYFQASFFTVGDDIWHAWLEHEVPTYTEGTVPSSGWRSTVRWQLLGGEF
jgi:hypothetical protein